MILRINLVQNYSSQFGNSQQQFTVTDGCVKSIPPIQQNSLKNGYDENKAYGNSYENKCATNYSIIHYRFQLVFCLGCFGAIMTPGPDSHCRGVRRPGCRLSEEGSDVPCVLLPGQRVLLERSIECVCHGGGGQRTDS